MGSGWWSTTATARHKLRRWSTAIAAAGGEAVAIKADVTVSDDVTAMVGEIAQRWAGVDVLVSNALIPYALTSFAELTWEQLGGKLDRELQPRSC